MAKALPGDGRKAADLLAEVVLSQRKIATAKEERRRAVVAALQAGVPGAEIARALGLTRHRIYQIRDGR